MLAFIHVAKTAGQTVETMLASSYGIRHVASPDWLAPPADPWNVEYVVPKYSETDFRRLKKLCPFLKSIGGHGIALWSGIDKVQPTQYFAFVREPVKRGASHFQYHQRHSSPCLDWEHWVDWPVHHNHQVKMFSRQADPEEAIRKIQQHEVFVGLTERFDESLVMLKKFVAPDLNIAYVRTNVARDNQIADKLLADSRACDQIRVMYKEEFALHDFVVNEWYPRFQKEYGPTLEQDVMDFRKQQQKNINWLKLKSNRLYFKLIVKPQVLSYKRRQSREHK